MEKHRERILVLCPFPEGVAAGQRLKYEQYLEDWRARGWDVTVSSYMDLHMWRVVYRPGWLLEKLAGVLRGHLRRVVDIGRTSKFELVYIFMWVTPFGSTLFERLVRILARRLIYDVEDSVTATQRLSHERNPNALFKPFKSKRKMRFLIRMADHVITSSPFANADCELINRRGRATYITSSVDTNRFLARATRPDGPVTIGWTGTYSTRDHLDLLRSVFARLATRRAYRLLVIGNFDYDLPGVDLTVVQWSEAREIEDLQCMDIGVYPLPIDEWVLGKSGLKAIQYMAMSLPIVATRVGTTPLLIDNMIDGILVNTDDEWVTALKALIDDPSLRHALGAAARQKAVERFSREAVAPQYRRILMSTLSGAEAATREPPNSG
jgi:glycosyltransferase involved in cell wall biosynthesis